MMKKVILARGRDYTLARRHPWIFSGAVASVEGEPGAGETVAVESAAGARLGWGTYSPASQIRVRMLTFDAGAPEPDAAFVAERVRAAVARREAFRAAGETTAYRLVNAENDGLPGVTADFYAGWAVVQLATAGAEFWKETVARALMESVPGCRGVYNRSDVDARAREGLAPATGVLAGAEPPELIEIREGAIRYFVDVRRGHKTGFYLDQRDARAAVGALAAGRDVLNCFSYTGGFGLAALAGGAKSVTHVDMSGPALALARKNTELLAQLPQFMNCGSTCTFIEADVFKQLRLYRDQARTFDMIVLDPPKFADTKAGIMRATRGYKDINLIAMKLLRPGGILATFSCSGAMNAPLFEKVCAEAAADARRGFQIIGRTGPGADHPVALAFPEGAYLKGLILRAAD